MSEPQVLGARAISVPDFAETVPMFVSDAHRALSKELAQATSGFDLFDHDARASVAKLRDANLFSLVIPGKYGGRVLESVQNTSIDVRALCIVREALGYTAPMADSIFAVQGLGSYPFVLAGESPEALLVLSEAAKGKRVGAFALTEPEAGSDVASMRAVAKNDGDAWVLEGEKVFISNVGLADHFVVFANADPSLGKKGISAFMVDANAKGLALEKIPMSVDHPLGRLVMKGCRARAMIGQIGQGMRLALGTLDVFRTSVGAAACGMAKRALDETVSRVRARVQFEKRLVDQPMVQAILADMTTELDAARLLVYRAAWHKDQGARASNEVAMAKMYATESAQRIIDRAVQLHGGLGVTTGSVVEQLYREIRPLRIYEGTTEIQKLIIGSSYASQKG